MNLKTKIWKYILRLLSENSDQPFSNSIQKIAYAVYRSSYNPNYHFEKNGELRVIKIVSSYFKKKVFFDVGANVGNWTGLVSSLCNSDDRVFSFEPSSLTYKKLIKNVNKMPYVSTFNLGLSNNSNVMEIFFSLSNPEKSTVEFQSAHTLNKVIIDYKAEKQNFITGDDFCKKNKVSNITFLKIDVEGHDYKVLEGFQKLLQEGGVQVIQFEYNRHNLYTGNLLNNFYKLLNTEYSGDAYCIGRIFPNSVRFKDFESQDENFIDGNFLAVRKELVELIDILKKS